MREYRVSMYRAFSDRPTRQIHQDGRLAHTLAAQFVEEAKGRHAVVEQREVTPWVQAGVFDSVEEGRAGTAAASDSRDAGVNMGAA